MFDTPFLWREISFLMEIYEGASIMFSHYFFSLCFFIILFIIIMLTFTFIFLLHDLIVHFLWFVLYSCFLLCYMWDLICNFVPTILKSMSDIAPSSSKKFGNRVGMSVMLKKFFKQCLRISNNVWKYDSLWSAWFVPFNVYSASTFNTIKLLWENLNIELQCLEKYFL